MTIVSFEFEKNIVDKRIHLKISVRFFFYMLMISCWQLMILVFFMRLGSFFINVWDKLC